MEEKINRDFDTFKTFAEEKCFMKKDLLYSARLVCKQD